VQVERKRRVKDTSHNINPKKAGVTTPLSGITFRAKKITRVREIM
jgi:hypothetical protein